MFAIDQVRIPWLSLKQFSFAAAPVLVIPLALALAAINEYVTILIFATVITFIGCSYYYNTKRRTRSRFFCVWIFWSIVYITLFFELTVPLLELLPEENLVLVLLALGAFSCLWRTNSLAALNNVGTLDSSYNISMSSNGSEENQAVETSKTFHPQCKYCKQNNFTEHCFICSSCVLKRRHHSYWLDCCIGEWNYKHYLLGLILTELSLLVGIYLTLTAICHPFLVVRFGGAPIMLLEDCTGVYDDYKLSIAFVIAMYAILIAGLIFLFCVRQLYNFFRGGTNVDCQQIIF